MFEPPSLPAAGWYPDPSVPDAERWWNGREWEPEWRSTGLHTRPGSLPDIGDWLSRAFRRALLRWRSVATIALLTSAPISILTTVGTHRLVDGVIIIDNEVTGWSNSRLPLAIILAVIGILWSAVGMLAITWLMLHTVDEIPVPDDAITPSTAEEGSLAIRSIGAALRTLPRAIGWTVLMGLAFLVVLALVTLMMVVVLPLGILLLLAVIPVAIWVAIRFAFVPQAIVDRPGNPFHRSTGVVADRWWAVFGRILLVGVIIWGASTAVNMVGSLVRGAGAAGAFRTTPIDMNDDGRIERFELAEAFPLSTGSIIIGVVSAVALSICVSGFYGAAYAELYRTRHPAE